MRGRLKSSLSKGAGMISRVFVALGVFILASAGTAAAQDAKQVEAGKKL